MITASPSRSYSGYHEATEEEDSPGPPGNGIWKKKCGWQASGTAGGRGRWKHSTELDKSQDGVRRRQVVCGLCCTGCNKV